jgi:hypothetical protein
MEKLLKGQWCALLVLLILFQPLTAICQELQTRYATVQYANTNLLHDFDDELYLGRQLGGMLKGMRSVSRQDDIKNKIDLLVEKVELVLDMFPARVHFTLVLLPSRKDVQQMYRQKYGKRVSHIAYYSLTEETIYIAVDDASLRVFSHELGHMIVDHYFEVRPPYRIHEVLAQYAEKHVTD